jgi:hypothetical protein
VAVASRWKKKPDIIEKIELLMENETAGDPMTDLKWTRRTTSKIARELAKTGIGVSPNTVGRILKELGYSLRVNSKKISSGSRADRNEQFENIAALRERFSSHGAPIISVDTKKKENVGNFKNPGAAWNRKPVAVHDHDFRSLGRGVAAPYGIYDVEANCGSVFIGTSYDTPQFAVDSIEKWWRYSGQYRYKGSKELLILADCGGSNGYRCRAWKLALQQLADKTGLTINVSHYPPGASKWNPIEHKLFSFISKNWAGRPLDSFKTIQNYISTTSTSTGLAVKAYIEPKDYQKGAKVSDAEMRALNITPGDALPQWNYSFAPR